jgi:hypothetical protein
MPSGHVITDREVAITFRTTSTFELSLARRPCETQSRREGNPGGIGRIGETMRALRLIVATAMTAVGLLVFAQAGPSLACSCAMSNMNDQVKIADVVATGTLTDIKEPDSGPVISSADPIQYVVDVDHAYKGGPPSRLAFTSARLGESCGLEGMHVDRRYMFFLLRDDSGHLSANLCGGTRLTTDGVETKVTHVTGPPVAPANVANPSTHRIDEGSPAESAIPMWLIAAGAGGLAVLAVVGGYVWRRRLNSVHDHDGHRPH